MSEAVDMTTLYRQQHQQILQASWQNQNILPLSETFSRGAFDILLSKPGCTALRIYYGMSQNNQVHALFVAVNENNEDILPSSLNEEEDEDVIEKGNRCPPICPPSSPLNE